MGFDLSGYFRLGDLWKQIQQVQWHEQGEVAPMPAPDLQSPPQRQPRSLVSQVRVTCVHAQSLQSSPTLCNPMDCSPPGSSVHGISQARILEWVAVPSSRGSSHPGIKLMSLMPPASAGGVFTTRSSWEALTLTFGRSVSAYRENVCESSQDSREAGQSEGPHLDHI